MAFSPLDTHPHVPWQARGCAVQGQGLYKGQKVRRGRDIDAPIVKRLEDAPTLEQLKKLSFDQIVAVGEQLLVIGREVTSEARKFRRRCRKSCAEMSRREDRVLYAGVQCLLCHSKIMDWIGHGCIRSRLDSCSLQPPCHRLSAHELS